MNNKNAEIPQDQRINGFVPSITRSVQKIARSGVYILILASFIQSLAASVTLAPLFRDGAVLQHGKEVPVWGKATPGEIIIVTFSGQTARSQTDSDGNWNIKLNPLQASAQPSTLKVKGETETVSVYNVVVGEVWLASGQSNMAWLMGSSQHPPYGELLADHPVIRQFKSVSAVANTPAFDNGGTWQEADVNTVGSFSGVATYFALDLYRELGVPIGIINSSLGSTRIQAWLDSESAASENGPSFAKFNKEWDRVLANYPRRMENYTAAKAEWEKRKDAAKKSGVSFHEHPPSMPWGPGHLNTPSGLYNGAIAPHVPYAIRGIIWYQGEANATQAGDYAPLFQALIQGWRKKFGQGDLPFYWVQLSSYKGKGPELTEWAQLREAQSKALVLPQTGQAVSIDVGNPDAIHPTDKYDVGHRLALLALSRTYGVKNLQDSGPQYQDISIKGSSVVIRFKPSSSALYSPKLDLAESFEVAGEDRNFYPADTANIVDNTLVVSSKKVGQPVAVRYAWRNLPQATLFNEDGLPASPFRSDKW